ncbi:dihydropyrimidinase [soil metagenome]
MTTKLIVRGGTIITADGRREADVLVEGEQITAVEARLPDSTDARELDARGLLVLPGVVDVHTHTRLASAEQPDRFFQDSVAAAFGGTTTFLAFNNPGTGSPRTGSLVEDVHGWRVATDGDSAVDYALSLVITPDEPDAVTEVAAVIEAGVPTFKAFMIYDFGVPDATLDGLLRAACRHGGMLEVHCEDRAALEANTARLLAEGRTAPRHHADSRPPVVEADGTRRAIAMAEQAGAPLYVVHLSCAAALDEVRAGRARGVEVFAETCPHYLALDDSRYELPDEQCACYVISPPLRPPADRDALWTGLTDGSLALVATDHVPDRQAVEKQTWRESFDRISNGGPGIETMLSVVYSEGVARGRITVERMVDLLSTTPARLFGLGSKGAIDVGRDADIVIFDPGERRTLTARELHHSSDYTPFEGMAVTGGVLSVLVRGELVVRDGHFVGRRGHGRFQERRLAWR